MKQIVLMIVFFQLNDPTAFASAGRERYGSSYDSERSSGASSRNTTAGYKVVIANKKKQDIAAFQATGGKVVQGFLAVAVDEAVKQYAEIQNTTVDHVTENERKEIALKVVRELKAEIR